MRLRGDQKTKKNDQWSAKGWIDPRNGNNGRKCRDPLLVPFTVPMAVLTVKCYQYRY